MVAVSLKKKKEKREIRKKKKKGAITQRSGSIAIDIKKGICDGFKRGIKGIFWI